MKREKILVTSALPYANGPIHFGHLAGAYLPADIFVRYKRASGADVVYICGTDEHGFAITVSAQKEGIAPQALVDRYHTVITDIFKKFEIEFDHFSRTTKPHHYKLSQQFFTDLYNNGYISSKVTEQLYCPTCNLFLADRFVEGTCPHCGYTEARGDECGQCGKWIDPLELIEPRCKVSGDKPVARSTKHWFLELGKFSDRLQEWIGSHPEWKPNVTKFIGQMIKDGLNARPITRDMDWGIPVPLEEAKGKVLYVWFDAPIGYISSTMEWAEKQGYPDLWKEYWQNPECRLIHFIGKDNLPFHCVVWPSLLMGQNQPFNLPTDVPANEFYHLEGKQFSKSTGWYVDLDGFFEKYSSDSIRYAIAANAPETKDSAFSWKDFQNRNNGELADVYGNFILRALKFTCRFFDGKVPQPGIVGEIEKQLLVDQDEIYAKIEKSFNHFEVRRACSELMELARLGNKYFDTKAPWASRKADLQDCATALYYSLQLCKRLAQIAFPIIPGAAKTIWGHLSMEHAIGSKIWKDEWETMLPVGHPITDIAVLFPKIEDAQIEEEIAKLGQMVDGNKSTDVQSGGDVSKKNDKKKMEKSNALSSGDEKDEGSINKIEFTDFGKIDLRVAKILSATDIPASKKLLLLKISLGTEERSVVAGIKERYTSPAELVGKKIVVLANLQPAKLMGHESQAMVLAAKGEQGLDLVWADERSQPGDRVA